jgi:Flp pilus assembly protein CpaB
LAALFAALLVRVALPGVAQAFGDGVPVVVLAGAAEVGATLDEQDLRLVKVPPAVAASGALTSADQALGRRLGVSLAGGTILQEGLLLGAAAQDQLPAGRVAAAVRLTDPGMAALAAPGDRLDILASPGASGGGSVAPAQVLAKGALVLGATKASAEADGALAGAFGSGTAGDDQTGLLLVAVTPSEAQLISGAASWAVVSAVLVG